MPGGGKIWRSTLWTDRGWPTWPSSPDLRKSRSAALRPGRGLLVDARRSRAENAVGCTGGLSPGAPKGSRNGNYTNGGWTADAIEERRWLRSLVRDFAKAETGR